MFVFCEEELMTGSKSMQKCNAVEKTRKQFHSYETDYWSPVPFLLTLTVW